MSTRGAVPPNFTSPTGQFRLLAADVNYTNASNGFGDYELFSDDEINGLIGLHPDSLLRAIGYGYLALAANAALQSKDIQDYDLAADLTKRAGDLRSTARAYFDRADFEANLTGADSTFGITEHTEHHPEGWYGNRIKPTERDTYGWGAW